MESKSLVASLMKSMKPGASDIICEFAEIGLDSCVENDAIKNIPFISTVVSLYHIGKTVREIHHIAKINSFINEVNNGIKDENELQKLRNKLSGNDESRNKELEYILLIIDRYMNAEKPAKLAKLYLAYLDEKINWNDFLKYSEVIDRFLPGDCKVLCLSATYRTENDSNTDAIQRLIALGLIIEDIRKSSIQQIDSALIVDPPEIYKKKERYYSRTEFGNKLVEILQQEG